MGFQSGNFQFIERYKSGPFNFNISKNGVSTSIKIKEAPTTFSNQITRVLN